MTGWTRRNFTGIFPAIMVGWRPGSGWMGMFIHAAGVLSHWETYLNNHEMEPEEIIIPDDPIQAAANIATSKWASSDTAILALDGSNFEDTIDIVFERSNTLNSQTSVETLSSDDEKLFSEFGFTMFLDKNVGAVALQAFDVTATGDDYSTSLSNIIPQYFPWGGDWWPIPNDNRGGSSGDATDLFFPITKPGLWSASTSISGNTFSSYKLSRYQVTDIQFQYLHLIVV